MKPCRWCEAPVEGNVFKCGTSAQHPYTRKDQSWACRRMEKMMAKLSKHSLYHPIGPRGPGWRA